MKRLWPCKTYKKEELKKYGGSALRLYFSDIARVDLGEAIFRPLASFIPTSVHPNTITYASLSLNILLLLIAFLIPVAVHHGTLPAVLCIVCCVLNAVVSAGDALDGMHARGTKQCSDLGALLDHYFDSISTVMNATTMVLIFDSKPFYNAVGVFSSSMIFHMQLLLNYYYDEYPRVIGVEVQLLCSAIDVIMAIIFYFELYSLVEVISILASIFSLYVWFKYIKEFTPKFTLKMTQIQLFIFTATYLVLTMIYFLEWISTFEFCLSGVLISWDFNGGVVTHLVLKQDLPRFHVYYFVAWIAICIEHLYLAQHYSSYIEFGDNNNLHLSTICLWIFISIKNFTHFKDAKLKLDEKGKLKLKKNKKNNQHLNNGYKQK